MNTWCRESSHRKFENWAVIALGGIPNKTKVGDFGIDGRIFPVGAEPMALKEGGLALEERWYPIQVKQKDKAGRPDIDAFETAMRRSKRKKGFFVAFDYSDDALREIDCFSKPRRHHPAHRGGNLRRADCEEAGVRKIAMASSNI